MQDRDPPAPPSSHEVAGEDFLFHLYRGSELLQDNRVHDAKAELEQALKFQPSDPKGQDLLGIVYFRLGLYPRAIAIYEQLVQSHPDAIEPRVNLGLSYLKTGQAAAARAELERVLEQNPSHSRAWGYLGLAFQRLGDYERASHSFAAGGHDVMARRLLDMAMQTAAMTGAPPPISLVPEANNPRSESRQPPSTVDGQAASLRDGPPPTLPRISATTWTAIEPEGGPSPILSAEGAPSLRGEMMPLPPAALSAPLPPSTLIPEALSERPPRAAPPAAIDRALRDMLIVYPRALPIALHPSGVVLVQAASGFAARLEAIRSMALGGPGVEPMPRHIRGRQIDEPLGGAAAPILNLPGKSELVLAASKGRKLVPLALGEDPLYLREDALIGFEPSVTYENGRLPVGDGDAIAMVQLRGPGAVVAALPEEHYAVEVTEGRSTTVRSALVVAWFGRLLPRALFASEAPAGARGLVAFSGEGMVLLDGRG